MPCNGQPSAHILASAEAPHPKGHQQRDCSSLQHAEAMKDKLPFGWGRRLPKPSTAGMVMSWPPPRHIRAPPQELEPIQAAWEGREEPAGEQEGGAGVVVYDSEEASTVLEQQEEEEEEEEETAAGSQSIGLQYHKLADRLKAPAEVVRLKPWYSPIEPDDHTLIFESRFEGGNLHQALRRGEFEYDLLLQPDTNTSGHTQWFYFGLRNARAGGQYRFHIRNFYKSDSLYARGMRPLFYSSTEAESSGVGWVRAGKDVRYSANSTSGSRDYTVSFTLSCFDHGPSDQCYVSFAVPFTYTDQAAYLDDLMADHRRSVWVRRRVLCTTPMGNVCELLTITDFHDDATAFRRRKGIVISARVHPGESNSSFMCKGLVDFLVSDDAQAHRLRQAFIFKVVPMLNPDGCLVGNHRCSISGLDLNRTWTDPNPRLTPEIASLKRVITALQQDREVVLYCDLHGHSKMHNAFLYGCSDPGPSSSGGGDGVVQHFAQALAECDPSFSLRDCSFEIERSKESTGRVVVHRELGIEHSFTLEASFLGPSIGPLAGYHFNTQHYEALGQAMAQAMLRTFLPGSGDGPPWPIVPAEEGEARRESRRAGGEENESDTGDSDDGERGDEEGDESKRARGQLGVMLVQQARAKVLVRAMAADSPGGGSVDGGGGKKKGRGGGRSRRRSSLMFGPPRFQPKLLDEPVIRTSWRRAGQVDGPAMVEDESSLVVVGVEQGRGRAREKRRGKGGKRMLLPTVDRLTRSRQGGRATGGQGHNRSGVVSRGRGDSRQQLRNRLLPNQQMEQGERDGSTPSLLLPSSPATDVLQQAEASVAAASSTTPGRRPMRPGTSSSSLGGELVVDEEGVGDDLDLTVDGRQMGRATPLDKAAATRPLHSRSGGQGEDPSRPPQQQSPPPHSARSFFSQHRRRFLRRLLPEVSPNTATTPPPLASSSSPGCRHVRAQSQGSSSYTPLLRLQGTSLAVEHDFRSCLLDTPQSSSPPPNKQKPVAVNTDSPESVPPGQGGESRTAMRIIPLVAARIVPRGTTGKDGGPRSRKGLLQQLCGQRLPRAPAPPQQQEEEVEQQQQRQVEQQQPAQQQEEEQQQQPQQQQEVGAVSVS